MDMSSLPGFGLENLTCCPCLGLVWKMELSSLSGFGFEKGHVVVAWVWFCKGACRLCLSLVWKMGLQSCLGLVWKNGHVVLAQVWFGDMNMSSLPGFGLEKGTSRPCLGLV